VTDVRVIGGLVEAACQRCSLRGPLVWLGTLLLSLALFGLSETPVQAATITVTTTGDATANGDGCSLREAIVNANNNQQTNADCAAGSGVDTIAFHIPAATDPGCNAVSGICTITPNVGATVFPPITDPLTIDGYTQLGASPNTNATGGLNTVLKIEISGASFAAASTLPPVFRVQAGNSTIRGLAINRFTNGGAFSPAIVLESNGGNTIAGNFIGSNVGGTIGLRNNGGVGVRSDNNTIGGTTPAARNLFFNNSAVSSIDAADLEVNGSSNQVQGNLFGTSISGTAALAGSPGSGILLRSVDGSAASSNTIGGTTPAARNVVAGYSSAGIAVRASGSGNVVQGNAIGTDADGSASIPNLNGVVVDGGSSVQIGGPAPGSGNLIRFNLLAGVVVRDSSTGVSILGNSIIGNGTLAIDLGGDGADTNDTADPDTGPNNRQNSPVITSPVAGAGASSIQGSLNSTPSTTFRVELFSNFGCDTSGFGEAETFLGSVDVTTDGGGNAHFSAPFAVPGGRVAAATATDADGNTSELSACPQTRASTDLSIDKTGPTAAAPGSTVAYTVTVTNAGAATADTVAVIDPTPPGLPFVGNSGACSTAYPCQLGTLAAGQSRTITSTYTVPSPYTGPSTLENTATVSTTTIDTNAANDSDSTSLTVQAGLGITKTGPPTVDPGTEVVYTISVTNATTVSVTGVIVTDTPSAALVFRSNSGACVTAFPCNLGTLAPGASQVVTATYLVQASFNGPYPVVNTAMVTGTASGGLTLTAQATAQSGQATQPPAIRNNDEDDDHERRKLTEEQRQQKQHTNRGNKDDVHTEGNVVGVRLTLGDPVPPISKGFIVAPDAVPYVLIANKDGVQQIRLHHDAALVGPSISVGQYVSADGEKISEQQFVADDLEIER
jgi:uncharacterized repeat protein (TIGR01451 family)/CSLREA domain-containing protein